MYQWDEAKRQTNLAQHGVDFGVAVLFEWDTALTIRDTRQDYSEPHFLSIGFIGARLHVMAWTPRRTPDATEVRIISLRKANARETNRYADP